MAINSDEPFGLPPGSIRAGLTFALVLGAFAALFTSKVTIEGFLAISGPVTALYFGAYATAPGKQAPVIGHADHVTTAPTPSGIVNE